MSRQPTGGPGTHRPGPGHSVTSPRALLGLLARGAAMGAADVVPGVSGGTVALLTGIYDRLIANIGNGARVLGRLAMGDARGAVRNLAQIQWGFLVPLGVGLLGAVVLLAGIIEDALVDHPEPMAGLFLGLVAASVVVAGRDVAWTAARLATAGLVGLALFVALGWQGAPVADPSAPALFGAGAVAICAMVLPGVSGSFLLLMMGMYATIIDIIDDRLLSDALVFGTGALLGLACFSTLLSRLLAERPHEVLAAMVGLLVGSTRVLWPWPHGVGVVSHHGGQSVDGTGLGWPDTAGGLVSPSLLALVAVVVVLGLDHLARRRPGH